MVGIGESDPPEDDSSAAEDVPQNADDAQRARNEEPDSADAPDAILDDSSKGESTEDGFEPTSEAQPSEGRGQSSVGSASSKKSIKSAEADGQAERVSDNDASSDGREEGLVEGDEGAASPNDSTKSEDSKTYTGGSYKVGANLPEGEYLLTGHGVDGKGDNHGEFVAKWEGERSPIKKASVFHGTFYVALESGWTFTMSQETTKVPQGTLRRGCLILSRPTACTKPVST